MNLLKRYLLANIFDVSLCARISLIFKALFGSTTVPGITVVYTNVTRPRINGL